MDTEELAPEEGVAEELPVEEQEEQQEEEPGLEDIASTMGWSPKDNWRGDPDEWKPAGAFLQKTAEINRNLSSSVRSLESKLDNLSRTSARITEMQVEKARDEILADRQRAFDEGDTEAFNNADKKLQTLDVPVPQVEDPPEVQNFRQRNTWFGQNEEASRLAVSTSDEYAKKGLSPAKQLEMAEREVKKVFPELFPAKAKPAPLNKPGARSQAQPKGFTMSTLPAEARKMADDYAKKGLSNEEFLKAYNEEVAQ